MISCTNWLFVISRHTAKGIENTILHRQWIDLENIIQFLVFLKTEESSENSFCISNEYRERYYNFFILKAKSDHFNHLFWALANLMLMTDITLWLTHHVPDFWMVLNNPLRKPPSHSQNLGPAHLHSTARATATLNPVLFK